jgi:hypothetical protein
MASTDVPAYIQEYADKSADELAATLPPGFGAVPTLVKNDGAPYTVNLFICCTKCSAFVYDAELHAKTHSPAYRLFG